MASVGALGSRLGALATGTALAGAAAVVAAVDPAGPGSRFPRCAFHSATGLWCPGCGLTRATHQLLRGDLAAALSSNVFTPLVLAAVVLAWGSWTVRAFARRRARWVRSPGELLPARAGPLLGVALVAYGVLRNVPWAPLRALAP